MPEHQKQPRLSFNQPASTQTIFTLKYELYYINIQHTLQCKAFPIQFNENQDSSHSIAFIKNIIKNAYSQISSKIYYEYDAGEDDTYQSYVGNVGIATPLAVLPALEARVSARLEDALWKMSADIGMPAFTITALASLEVRNRYNTRTVLLLPIECGQRWHCHAADSALKPIVSARLEDSLQKMPADIGMSAFTIAVEVKWRNLS